MSLPELIPGPDESLPWLEDDENVVAEDRAWPTEGALDCDIPGPLVVPVSQSDED